jgi:hypothetical protein
MPHIPHPAPTNTYITSTTSPLAHSNPILLVPTTYRRGSTPQHQPSAPSGYYPNNHNQSARGTTSPIGWSSPSSAAQGPSAAYPQGGRSPQYGGLYCSDCGAYSNASRQQGNATPNVLQDEYVLISATSHCFAANLFSPGDVMHGFSL